jgi:hypothetical protein
MGKWDLFSALLAEPVTTPLSVLPYRPATPAWPTRSFCYSSAGGGETGSAEGLSVWLSDLDAVPDLTWG